uniref:Reverse transcriptase domain-containing protein n=1 Tax=Caenorhabditis japonica TaxID=281687 RepID=A0A8R1I3U4_CAEJA
MIQTGSLKNWKLKLDHELPGSTRLRPDIYLKSPNGSEIILGDVTIPYEHGIEAMQTAWQKKIEKYEEGFKYLRSTGKKLTIVPIVVGALGSWWKPTTDSLVSLGIDKNTISDAQTQGEGHFGRTTTVFGRTTKIFARKSAKSDISELKTHDYWFFAFLTRNPLRNPVLRNVGDRCCWNSEHFFGNLPKFHSAIIETSRKRDHSCYLCLCMCCEKDNLLLAAELPGRKRFSGWEKNNSVMILKRISRKSVEKIDKEHFPIRGGGDNNKKKVGVVSLAVEKYIDSKSVILRLDYPTDDLYGCFVGDCPTKVRAGLGADHFRYLSKHMKDKHQMKVNLTYKCTLCKIDAPGTSTKATVWMKSHLLKVHGMTAETRTRKNDCIGTKFSGKPETVKEKTPEKIADLEGKIQTRSVSKRLSALKESAKKTAVEEGVAPAKAPKLVAILEEADERKKSSARRSLAPLINFDDKSKATPMLPKRSELPDSISTLQGVERLKASRKFFQEKDRRASNVRRESLVPPASKSSIPKKRFNTWCLDSESTADAWLTDEVIVWYIDKLITDVTTIKRKYKVLDPIWWPKYKIYGFEHIREELKGPETYFFPVCENNHWILLIMSPDKIWYSNSIPVEPEGDVEKFMRLTNKTRSYFDSPVPTQKDNVNCGVHVCLVAQSIIVNRFWYEELDVKLFRKIVKFTLLQAGYELYSEPYATLTSAEPDQNDASEANENDKDWADTTQTLDESTLNQRDDEVFLLRPTIVAENEQKVFEEAKIEADELLALDEQRVSELLTELTDDDEVFSERDQPEVVDRAAIPSLMALELMPPPKADPADGNPQRNIRKVGKQMGKKPKVPTGKPDELVIKVRDWFSREYESYLRDGRSFQRLQWITDVLTAAILKASVGDEQTVEKIRKRCPPMEMEEGEMATQTEVKKAPQNDKRHADSDNRMASGSLRELYSKNRPKAFNVIVGKDSKQCEIPIDKIEKFFLGTTSETNVPSEVLQKMGSKIPKLDIGDWIEQEFSEKEISEALKKTKDTAPGVDGLRYHHLSWFDPTSKLLAQLYNECRKHRKIPEHWKEAETVLLYKGGDESKPDNWRPISLMPTIYKLYSSLWNRRIRSVEGVMSKCQRGFQEREGCAESIGILRTAIEIAKGRRKNLSVAWLDLTNAFGSVPHELIESTLKAYGFPPMVIDIVMDMYKGASIRVKTRSEKSNQILIKSGVKQGDPISPTLFNMCLENVIRRHLETACGHKCLNTTIKVLAFADDMAVLSESKDQLQRELKKLDDDCTPLNLIFKPAKCASLIIDRGQVDGYAEIFLKGLQIRNLKETDTYKYLGVQTGIQTRTSALSLMTSVAKELDMVVNSDLLPHQKLDCTKSFVLPKMTYMYMNSVPKLTELREFTKVTMKAVKAMHNIPLRGSPLEYIQLPIGKGGLGVPSPKNVALIAYLASTMKRLWSDDAYIQRIYSDYLEEVAREETYSIFVTTNDLAKYLSGELETDKKAFGFNSFTRIQEVCKSLTKIQDSPLHKLKFIVKDEKLAILVQAVEHGPEKIFTEKHVKKLQQLLKAEVNDALLHRFMNEKRVKSEVIRVVQQYPQCNSFVRTGGKVSLSAHKFVHKARLNLLNCNYNNYGENRGKVCRRCGHANETQWHILNECRFNLSRLITMRHDAVLYKVKQLIKDGEKKNWDLEIDQEVSVSSRLRPDIYMTSPDRNAIIIADVTCPYEHGTEAMERAWENKVEKYEQGFNYLRKMGKKLTILPIVIGSLGTWWAKTSESLTELGIDRNVVHRTIPELCSIVLEYSKNCYWHHIFGDTYVNAPFKFGGEKPSGNDWKGKAPKRTLPPDKA